MIIWGWRTFVSKIGILFRRLCSHCKNEEYWILNRTTKWFTLFFIPVLPLGSKYFLSCPICQYGFDLDREQVATAKPLAELNQLLVDGKVTETDYHARLNLLTGSVPKSVEAETSSVQSLASSENKLSYCADCGHQTTKELRFCGNCGTEAVIK